MPRTEQSPIRNNLQELKLQVLKVVKPEEERYLRFQNSCNELAEVFYDKLPKRHLFRIREYRPWEEKPLVALQGYIPEDPEWEKAIFIYGYCYINRRDEVRNPLFTDFYIDIVDLEKVSDYLLHPRSNESHVEQAIELIR